MGVPVGRLRAFVSGGCPQPCRLKPGGELALREPKTAVRSLTDDLVPQARGDGQHGAPGQAPEARAKAGTEHRQLDERLSLRGQHSAEFGEVRAHDLPPGKMLEDEVAEDGIGDTVLDGLEPAARDESKHDILRPHVPPGQVEHGGRHVHRDHAIETLGEMRRHPTGPAADLDARAPTGIVAEPAEQAVELVARSGRVADVELDVARGRSGVPGRPHARAGHRARVARLSVGARL